MSRLMVILVALVACLPAQGRAAQNEFSQLFAATCMANVFTPAKLVETLSTPLTPQIAPERAEGFLHGHPGKAWQVFFGNGQYAVMLLDSGLCAAFARSAPVEEVHEGFKRLVSVAPEPLKARQVSQEQAGPNDADLTSMSYVWSRPGEQLDIVFTLTTSRAAVDPPIQAMASVGLSRPEP